MAGNTTVKRSRIFVLIECNDKFLITQELKDYKRKTKQPVIYKYQRNNYPNLYVLDDSKNTKINKEIINNRMFVEKFFDSSEFNHWQTGTGLNSIIVTHKSELLNSELHTDVFNLDYKNITGSLNDLLLVKSKEEKGTKWTMICTSKLQEEIDEFNPDTLVIYDMDRATKDWDINYTPLIKQNSLIIISHPWSFENTKDSLRIPYIKSKPVQDDEIQKALDLLRENLINYSLFMVEK